MDVLRREERVANLCGRQGGRVTRAQLKLLGLSDDVIYGWTKRGYLTRVHPKVYAVGHTAPSKEADLWAAVLYAGPDAELSHTSAAHHRGLIIYPPDVIHVSTPRVKVKSIPGFIQVHAGRSNLERSTHEGIPTTTVTQTVLDLAADPSHFKLLRRALAVLDYRDELNIRAVERICGKGRAGSKALKNALAIHQPELAHANGELEEALLYLCECFNIPVPRFNRRMYGFLVDAYWPDHNLVVEVDGLANHSKRAQIRTDRRKELTLRAHGLQVVRYDWPLVTGAPEEVGADLLRQLAAASLTR
jgi:predicted transcriptional regulator of viral defense system